MHIVRLLLLTLDISQLHITRWRAQHSTAVTVYPKKYAHGFVVLCFVVVMQSFIMNSHEVFIHIHQGCFAGTGAIVRLPQCQWSKPDGYGKISQCITTTKHSKAKTVCIFLGIYCTMVKRRSGFALAKKWYPIHRPHGQATGCFSRVLQWKMTVVNRESAVLCYVVVVHQLMVSNYPGSLQLHWCVGIVDISNHSLCDFTGLHIWNTLYFPILLKHDCKSQIQSYNTDFRLWSF